MGVWRMIMENLEKIKNKFEIEFYENQNKINELNNKIRIIQMNCLGDRALSVLTFSMVPWIVLILSLPKMVELISIPTFLIQPAVLGISAFIGVVSERSFAKKCKIQERLRKFSSARTQKELLE